ncbi:MAG TPA: hypothetical protein VGG10_14925 [Rhizomicrobium sp.]
MSGPLIVSRAQIVDALAQVDAIAAMERAFAAYSNGEAVVPPVGEILFADRDGEAHIKSGYIAGDDVFVVKVATGFYRNADLGMPANSGVVLAFSARDGLLQAILLDEGHLTNVRTAAAGAMAAKYLAPETVTAIGVLGSGVQARLQAEALKSFTPCRSIVLWARRDAAAEDCARDLRDSGFTVAVVKSPRDVAAATNLLVTATASKVPLLALGDIRPGTHINAVGADTAEKRELQSDLLNGADIVAVDSLVQSRERGELHHCPAVADRAVELGAIVTGHAPRRTTQQQITIADLTGVAVQDIEIAKAVLAELKKRNA